MTITENGFAVYTTLQRFPLALNTLNGTSSLMDTLYSVLYKEVVLSLTGIICPLDLYKEVVLS